MMDLQRDIEAALRIDSLPKILDAACSLVGMRRATFARVTETRWIACGIRDGDVVDICTKIELDVKSLICDDVRKTLKPVIVNSVGDDPVYKDHPAPIDHQFKSVISVPVFFQDGSFFGTLSALGDEPTVLDHPDTLRSFELFADLLTLNLDKELQLEVSRQELADERHTSQLREQFIAVLGHDLRNPLASVKTSAFVLRQQPENAELAGFIEQSVARMSAMIDDVMDFARGKLGDGIPVKLQEPSCLIPTLSQVLRELETAHPNRVFDVDLNLEHPVACDHGRMAQLVGNLLSNAVTHGDQDQPIRVRSAVRGGLLEIAVANSGKPIPPHAMGMLFQPFVRASAVENGEGLGLGLFIASEIARGHGGAINVSSGPAETRFTFRMPISLPSASEPEFLMAVGQ
jgi:signal transduction histidine kinase